MVNLATAREARLYGPALAVRRWEYIKAGVYMFGTLFLAVGLAALCASEGGVVARDTGLAVAGVALAVVGAVNAHDLGAHLASMDYRVGLVRFDPQLGIGELLAPAFHGSEKASMGPDSGRRAAGGQREGSTRRVGLHAFLLEFCITCALFYITSKSRVKSFASISV